jgi:hypothetical protein
LPFIITSKFESYVADYATLSEEAGIDFPDWFCQDLLSDLETQSCEK